MPGRVRPPFRIRVVCQRVLPRHGGRNDRPRSGIRSGVDKHGLRTIWHDEREDAHEDTADPHERRADGRDRAADPPAPRADRRSPRADARDFGATGHFPGEAGHFHAAARHFISAAGHFSWEKTRARSAVEPFATVIAFPLRADKKETGADHHFACHLAVTSQHRGRTRAFALTFETAAEDPHCYD